MIALSIARRTPASESALEIMLRSREGAQSKKFRLAAAIAFSYDYGQTSTNRATSCFGRGTGLRARNPQHPAVKREAEEDWGKRNGDK
jgi:hypothetical protein